MCGRATVQVEKAERDEQRGRPTRVQQRGRASPRRQSMSPGVIREGTVSTKWLREALSLPDDQTPFPWQEEIFTRFKRGLIDPALDIPTGLGKTAVMAIWLVAQACGGSLPRRLVYVVDRRAVVDQATEVAIQLRAFVDRNPDIKQRLGLIGRSLPISTLRGRYVDNKEWLEDPASPAIIVGTVDMTGSRLLFEGYGVSRKMRPFHAGLLGADALLVLDESHLVPPFEKLLEAVANDTAAFGPTEETLRQIVPSLRLMSLSATGRASGQPFGLGDMDLKHRVVRQRLDATKRLIMDPLDDTTTLPDALAERAWTLAENGRRSVRCIVFCDKREVAAATKQAIERRAKGDKQDVPAIEVDTELFVGGRRVLEREEAAQRLRELGFIVGVPIDRTRAAFVIATSAGEVGIDLDADHAVSDLVAWERMVQRLGRVNRRGEGKAEVIVIVEPEPKAVADALRKSPEERTAKEAEAAARYERGRAVRELLSRLPSSNGTADASPGALRKLKSDAAMNAELAQVFDAAITPAPLRPRLSKALVDAWSTTSLKEHAGRPKIDPWLRGWIEEEPQTSVVWRVHLPVRAGAGRTSTAEIEAFFEAAPPHAIELLETETFRVSGWLVARAKRLRELDVQLPAGPEEGESDDTTDTAPLGNQDVAAVVLTSAGDLRTTFGLKDRELIDGDKGAKRRLERSLAGATLVVDARMGGLKDGLLSDEESERPLTADDGSPWMGAPGAPPVVRFRVRAVEAGQAFAPDPQWRERFRLAKESSEDGEPTRWLIVQKWRHDAATEDDRSAGRPQLLHEHRSWTEQRARDLARRMALPNDYQEMLAIAASLHDEGKRSRRWQRAFNARSDGIYAKTSGPVNVALLDGYRHEFGSLLRAASDGALDGLGDDLRDLALHLVAAHHGFARPVISTSGCDDAPPSALEPLAREVALRFARVQKRWGPWGLAWWEALFRAADQQASRANEAADSSLAREIA